MGEEEAGAATGASVGALRRPGSMRVAWDRIIPQTNLTQDAIEGFASGNPELDHFWLDKSLTYSKIGMCAVHVAMKGEDIAGFYTISPSVIRGVGLPKSRQAGKPTMAHPSWLIGELAVRKDLRGKKENGSVGAALLCHAVHMACDLSVMAGGRLVMLDPLNDTLGKWYEDHGFLRLPDAKTMFMPLRNARSYMEQIGEPFFVF